VARATLSKNCDNKYPKKTMDRPPQAIWRMQQSNKQPAVLMYEEEDNKSVVTMKDTIIEMENFNYDKISTVMKITMIILVI
jgi:hypothetical protein